MRILTYIFVVVSLFLIIATKQADAATGRKITINQTVGAQAVYDSGFAKQVMRASDSGVKLWDYLLIENDAPGSGTSSKGPFTEPVYGDRMIKKILHIEDPRCAEANVVFFAHYGGNPDKAALRVTVNDNTTTFKPQNREHYGYVPIKSGWLKKGDNEITFACPEAKSPNDGYVFLIARADEYVKGGLAPIGPTIELKIGTNKGIDPLIKDLGRGIGTPNSYSDIGNYSMISTDGGRSWSTNGKGTHPSITINGKTLFGIEHFRDMYSGKGQPDKKGVVGEYTVRLNLRRHASEGILISPVIDLWSEPDKPAALIGFTEVEKLAFEFKGSTPAGTQITWQIRAGLSMDPFSADDWSQWIDLTAGAHAVVEPKGRLAMPPSHWDPERTVTLPKVRYIQWRAILTTTDPLKSPVVESVSVNRQITRRMEVPANIIVIDYHNPEILYSSTGFTYQSADEPMNQAVIDREDLDQVVAGAGGEFDAIVRLLDFASRRWIWTMPTSEYPKWNVVDILERAHSHGDGGMCIQFAAHLSHILTVMGYHARHVNIPVHEVVEVWCNEFDKWIFLDPTQGMDLYLYDKKTGVPLSLLDMHKAYYQAYGVKTPIDWMKTGDSWRTLKPDIKNLPFSFSTTDSRVERTYLDRDGYYPNTEFMRMMPRNDFSTNTIPEPLEQGISQWPWDGYVNWYDQLAPPKLQYSRHTDRECDFWPTLSRVRFEAVPEINGDMVFITMSTFTPSFKTYQVRVDDSLWLDSDQHYTWRFHSGRNRLEMRALSKFGVAGRPSFIECNFVAKHIPTPVNVGDIKQ